ncbi:MAG: ACT domain-containing protein, partial [Desulfocucumaceae bacterium]
DDIYAGVGEGTITATLVINRIRESMPEKKGALPEKYQALVNDPRAKPDWGRPTQGISVRGVDNLLIRLSHCCNPIPGDEIVGYITRGRGVSIHRADCRNLNFFKRGEGHRLVEVAWDSDFQAPFQVKLEISAADRAGMLSDVLAVLVEMKISASWVNARGRKDSALIEMLLEAKNKEQLEHIMAKIGRVKDVYDVKRTS